MWWLVRDEVTAPNAPKGALAMLVRAKVTAPNAPKNTPDSSIGLELGVLNHYIETGIPPLEVKRKIELDQFRYRLSHSPLTSLTFCM